MDHPRPHIRLLAVLVAVCAMAVVAPAQASGANACEAANATPASADGRTIVRATLCVLNAQRADAGLGSLRLNKRLSKAARRHAEDMDRRNYFSHNTLGGGTFVDRIRQTGYMHGARHWTVGENIAWGTRDQSAPSGVAEMWMSSPGHRANILNASFREIGIGMADGAPVARSAKPVGIYATAFGAKR
jgi:uncharacterized protein YkwD